MAVIVPLQYSSFSALLRTGAQALQHLAETRVATTTSSTIGASHSVANNSAAPGPRLARSLPSLLPFASRAFSSAPKQPWNCQSYSNYGLAAQQEQINEFEAITINVVTGNLRGSGSESRASIRLIGTEGVSPKIPLVDPQGEGEGFERNSTKTFATSVPRSIGQLRRVFIEKEKGDYSEQGEGWYLQHVKVVSETGESFVFQCNSWLGSSDCGDYAGPLSRNLLPIASTMFGLHLEDPQPVAVSVSAMAIPHPDKVKRSGMKGVNRLGYGFGGEDAYFYCQAPGGPFGMGVADGVFSWREHGVDPGQFSKALMDMCRKMVEAGMDDAFRVLQGATHHVVDEGYMGSAPVCLLTINPSNGLLHAANIGDSGFLIFGDTGNPYKMELKYRTNVLEHEFGYPYQLGHHETSSKVEDAELVCLHTVPGDIIVMGSDGLLDNVSEMEMEKELTSLRAQKASPSQMVQSLTKMAFEASIDTKRTTPYSLGASDFFQMVYNGGKKDDIAVLVAVVGAGEAAEDDNQNKPESILDAAPPPGRQQNASDFQNAAPLPETLRSRPLLRSNRIETESNIKAGRIIANPIAKSIACHSICLQMRSSASPTASSPRSLSPVSNMVSPGMEILSHELESLDGSESGDQASYQEDILPQDLKQGPNTPRAAAAAYISALDTQTTPSMDLSASPPSSCLFPYTSSPGFGRGRIDDAGRSVEVDDRSSPARRRGSLPLPQLTPVKLVLEQEAGVDASSTNGSFFDAMSVDSEEEREIKQANGEEERENKQAKGKEEREHKQAEGEEPLASQIPGDLSPGPESDADTQAATIPVEAATTQLKSRNFEFPGDLSPTPVSGADAQAATIPAEAATTQLKSRNFEFPGDLSPTPVSGSGSQAATIPAEAATTKLKSRNFEFPGDLSPTPVSGADAQAATIPAEAATTQLKSRNFEFPGDLSPTPVSGSGSQAATIPAEAATTKLKSRNVEYPVNPYPASPGLDPTPSAPEQSHVGAVMGEALQPEGESPVEPTPSPLPSTIYTAPPTASTEGAATGKALQPECESPVEPTPSPLPSSIDTAPSTASAVGAATGKALQPESVSPVEVTPSPLPSTIYTASSTASAVGAATGKALQPEGVSPVDPTPSPLPSSIDTAPSTASAVGAAMAEALQPESVSPMESTPSPLPSTINAAPSTASAVDPSPTPVADAAATATSAATASTSGKKDPTTFAVDAVMGEALQPEASSPVDPSPTPINEASDSPATTAAAASISGKEDFSSFAVDAVMGEALQPEASSPVDPSPTPLTEASASPAAIPEVEVSIMAEALQPEASSPVDPSPSPINEASDSPATPAATASISGKEDPVTFAVDAVMAEALQPCGESPVVPSPTPVNEASASPATTAAVASISRKEDPTTFAVDAVMAEALQPEVSHPVDPSPTPINEVSDSPATTAATASTSGKEHPTTSVDIMSAPSTGTSEMHQVLHQLAAKVQRSLAHSTSLQESSSSHLHSLLQQTNAHAQASSFATHPSTQSTRAVFAAGDLSAAAFQARCSSHLEAQHSHNAMHASLLHNRVQTHLTLRR
eukprot:gene7420-553_t